MMLAKYAPIQFLKLFFYLFEDDNHSFPNLAYYYIYIGNRKLPDFLDGFSSKKFWILKSSQFSVFSSYQSVSECQSFQFELSWPLNCVVEFMMIISDKICQNDSAEGCVDSMSPSEKGKPTQNFKPQLLIFYFQQFY